MESQKPRFYEFGPFRLDPVKRRLWRDGDTVTIQPKAFDTLLVLLKNRERVLDTDELIEVLWPDTAVEEQNLKVNISHLRKALGDDPHEHGYIVTIPGRGYRFVAAVREVPEEAPALAGKPTPSTVITGKAEEAEQGRASLSETAPMISPVPASPAPRRSLAGRLWILSLLLIGLVAGVFLVFSLAGRTKPQPTGVAVKSLAVLPFKPLGGPPRDESLELGMADALITQLSHVRQLTIRPTESVQKYAGSGQDPRVAARELRVDALLVGSVQRAGDGIRLSVQLIGARDGEVLWAETFDEQWTHIFAVQDAIATQVARALALRVTGAEREQLAKRDTDNTAAYREYLMGRHFRSQQTAEGLKRALQHYERAVELDPRYALAHAGVADSYLGFVTYRVLSGKEAYVKARASAAKARELNPSLSEAHMALAAVSLYHDWDWVAGERAFRRAIQLKPDNAEARMRYALALAWFERFDEALHEIGQARELDPLLRRVNLNTGIILYFARRYDEAIAESRRALALDPNFFQHHQMPGWAYVQARAYKDAIAAFKKALELGGGSSVEADLAHAYAVSGQTREAQKILNDLEDRSKRMYISPFDIAVVYVGLGDRDQAFAWLEKAYDERTRTMLSLKVNPRLDPLRSDPRLAALMRRVGVFKSK